MINEESSGKSIKGSGCGLILATICSILIFWVKRPGRKSNHSLSSTAEVKNVWPYICTPSHCCVIRHLMEFQGQL
jgi:hypothetical protein